VERQLGKLSAAIWEFAVEERMVSQYQEEQNLEWLIQKIERLIASGAEKAHGYIESGRRQRREAHRDLALGSAPLLRLRELRPLPSSLNGARGTPKPIGKFRVRAVQ
jgi:hypothetical protein